MKEYWDFECFKTVNIDAGFRREDIFLLASSACRPNQAKCILTGRKIFCKIAFLNELLQLRLQV